MGHIGKSVGILAKGIGSSSPSFVLEDLGDEFLPHPFQVSAYKDGSNVKVKVRAGTVNNLVPTISSTALDAATPPELTLTGDATHRIYLKASSASPPVFFPDTIVVESQTSDQTDGNTNGYLKIASVVVSGGAITAVNQFVYASQVLVRAKPGTSTALWSWSSR